MFDRASIWAPRPERARVVAHAGAGTIDFLRVVHAGQLSGGVNFVDHAVLPPGSTIGRHQHAADEEELYLVLRGEGRMWRDGAEFTIRAGDLVRNAPGGAHGLVNDGPEALELFVIELRVPA